MCGLLGCFNLVDFDVAGRLELLRHRGPDGGAVIEAGPATHGHVRLALVDLSSASAQPFRLGDAVLSFNGEIWNWRALRDELAALGCRFATSGDTEVLAHALDRWGTAALDRIEGMFAFAWSKGSIHILARDRFGEIPLYVHRAGAGFAWSSERKGLGRTLPAAPLPAGAWLDLVTGQLHQWYALPARAASNEPLAMMLDEGVRLRLLADAPLCVLISGGLDSSLILALARHHKPDVVAYTARLDEASPDLRAARRLCGELDVPLVEVPIGAPTVGDLEAAALAIELPLKAQVEIAALCLPLARAIGADGFKACLSGEAADELFGGYGSLCIKGSSADDEEWRRLRCLAVARMARGNFVRCNAAFMAAGVECRLPFMQTALVESALAMGKAECPPGKGALKRAARGLVPDWIIRRTKETFQGGAGMDEAASRLLPDPARFYRSIVATAYGAGALAH